MSVIFQCELFTFQLLESEKKEKATLEKFLSARDLRIRELELQIETLNEVTTASVLAHSRFLTTLLKPIVALFPLELRICLLILF